MGRVGRVGRWLIAGHPATKQWNTISSGENVEVVIAGHPATKTMEHYQQQGEVANSRASCSHTREHTQQQEEYGGS